MNETQDRGFYHQHLLSESTRPEVRQQRQAIAGKPFDLAVAFVVGAEEVEGDAAEAFYRHHDFLAFGSLPRPFILPRARLKS